MNNLAKSNDESIVQDVATYKDLQEILQIASLPLSERPDGIVVVLQYVKEEDADSAVVPNPNPNGTGTNSVHHLSLIHI